MNRPAGMSEEAWQAIQAMAARQPAPRPAPGVHAGPSERDLARQVDVMSAEEMRRAADVAPPPPPPSAPMPMQQQPAPPPRRPMGGPMRPAAPAGPPSWRSPVWAQRDLAGEFPLRMPGQPIPGQFGYEQDLAVIDATASSPEEAAQMRAAALAGHPDFRDHVAFRHSVAGLPKAITENQLAQQAIQARGLVREMSYAEQEAQRSLDARREAFRQAEIHEQRAQAARQRYREEYGAQMATYARATKELGEQVVDPERYWKNKGTAGRVMAALGVALGTVGSVLAKSPNHVMNFVTKEIEQDIRAQEQTLANKRGALDAQAGIIGMMRQYFQDEEMAREAARGHIYRTLAHRMQNYADHAKMQTVKSRALALAEGFNAEAEGTALQLEYMAKLNALRPVGVAAPTSEWRRMDQKVRDRYVPGMGLVMNSDARKSIMERRRNVAAIQAQIAKLRAIGKTPFASWTPEMRARADIILSDLKPRLAVARGQGAISAPEAEQAERDLPSVASLKPDFWTGADARLESLSGTLTTRVRAAEAQEHVEPVMIDRRIDPKSRRTEQMWRYTPPTAQQRSGPGRQRYYLGEGSAPNAEGAADYQQTVNEWRDAIQRQGGK